MIAACSVVGLAAIAFAFTRTTPEPEYDGKPLSFWLEALDSRRHAANTTEEWLKPINALTAIGTNAYPLLLEWTRREPPQLVMFAARKWRWKPLIRIVAEDLGRKEQASGYFMHFGRKASATVPMLSNIVVSARPDSRASSYAQLDLGAVGVEGYAALISIMNNTNLPVATRGGCMFILATRYKAERDSGGHEELALARSLQKCGADPDPAFRAKAKAIFQTHAPNLWTNNAASN